MSRSKQPPLWFCLLFLVVGLGVLGWGAWDLALAVQSAWWKTAPGVVTSSQMTSEISSGKSRNTVYGAKITYRYTVEGKTFTGDQVWFGQYKNSNDDVAREVVRTYPEGRKITVYHDPEEPHSAVLQPGVFLSTWILPGAGLLFASAGTWLLFRWWKMRS